MEPLTTPRHRQVPVEELQADLNRVCGAFSLQTRRPGGVIHGAVSGYRTGPFDTAAVALDASAVVRDARAIRQAPGEHFFLIVQESGCCRIAQESHSTLLSAGDMVLVDAARPSEFSYGAVQSRQISLHLPKEEIAGRFGHACDGGLPISRSDPLWLAMRAVLSKMSAGSGAQTELGEAMFSLLGAYVSSLRAGGLPERGTGLLSRALQLIDRYRSDPAFGPGELAMRLNVSERTLQRHFQPLGETPGRRLLERRLELAHARLTGARRRPGETVTSIALDCGFNDLSYFHREFRRKYGATPRTAANGS